MKLRAQAVCLGSCLMAGQDAFANVVGTDLQNFNSTTNGIDYVTVESSETLEFGIFNLGLFANQAVNSLPVYEDEGESQNRLRPNDTIFTGEMNIGVGLFKNFELGFNVPRILSQTFSNQDEAHGEFDTIGITSYRLTAKARLFTHKDWGFALSFNENINNIRNNPYLGKKQGNIHSVQMIADTHAAGFAMALNLGYRWREESEPLDNFRIVPTRNQWIGSLGVSYLFTSIDSKVIAEVYGSRPETNKDSTNQTRQASSLEGLLGVKFDYSDNLAWHIGGGSELIHGAASPDWRVYGGLNYTTGGFNPPPEPIASTVTTAKKKESRIILSSLHFATAVYDKLEQKYVKELQKIGKYIQSVPYQHIVVEGHTDSVGSTESNQLLSEKRADLIKRIIIKIFKVPPEKISHIGHGEERPIADNGNFQGRTKNRRVEIRIIY